ncbi:2-polyprenylphenol 6-hydroxylase [Glacieibacterium sp.]|uniref:2-polyprenylphenol 6-hydroxylase n=1 Tax=Glacieibacterium sp. TaxID=2860237 RepID=UPI003AFF96F4
MTSSLTHGWRLLRWGRTLGRHGALRGIEADGNAPAIVRRMARLARFGTATPAVPDYARAFEAIGPAAIKLGQALATRPDLIGEAAAQDLTRLQDALPPLPFAVIEAALVEAYAGPWQQHFISIDPVPVGAASIAQVHRGVTTDGRTVAIKVLRPGIEAAFAEAIETYEWAAAKVEAQGGEALRLRPRAVIASFKAWTLAELDLRREAASASELAEAMQGEPGFLVPEVDWARTTRRVLAIDWIDGVKMSDRAAVAALGLDGRVLAATLVRSFLRQAIAQGFFHADMHQGNLFVLRDGRVGVVDFGIMGRLDRRARVYLAQIIHGLLTGDYIRVAEIHFEAGYVPAHHNVGEFATALRAVGEPIRGLDARDISISNLLDGLFGITRSFDMAVQPHLLLLQKTMVMVEGVALTLDPKVNMWQVAEPFVRDWMREELGPEARLADSLVANFRSLRQLPRVFRQLIAKVPVEGAAPPMAPEPEPVPEVHVRARVVLHWWVALATAVAGIALGAALVAH